MAEITRVYRQSLPERKLVGKCYGEGDRCNGTFGAKWAQWFENGWFSPLRLPGAEPFQDCDAFIGLCRCREGAPFQYWIGVFLPPEAPVPAGYDSVTLPAGDVAVAWIRGREPEIYGFDCLPRLTAEGYVRQEDTPAGCWCCERYVSPRFTEPDEQGNVVLDMCFPVE